LLPEIDTFKIEHETRSLDAHATGMGSLLVCALGRVNPPGTMSWGPCL